MKVSSILSTLLAFAWVASVASADVIETKDGARLVGTVSGINGGKISFKTSYAGEIKIDQAEVVSLTMDDALAIRLDDGTTLEGTIEPQAEGTVVIESGDGEVKTAVTDVAATWAVGGTDPAILALQRKWSYEASLDVTGKSGNSENFGSAVSFSAVLDGKDDRLAFYSSYNQQESEGIKSADQFKAGVDYSNNFGANYSWYVRNEAGFDRIKAIDFYDVAGAGFGYTFIKKSNQTLTLRGGLSFRYEAYDNPLVADLSSAGLDFGLAHSYKWDNMKMNNSITFVPSFDDFADFRATHDSHFEMPLKSGPWKIRIGISNDFRSEPPVGLDELDTTWYTRMVLSWD
ncbi:MAG: hypothetical protein SynsKO_41340 [Synoicihabitans sp.]